MTDLSISLKLGITLVFVVLNGFFVAAEFALVTVRPGRIDALAANGSRRAQATREILARLDLYLSGCQMGITVSSLVLGWLAEPAVASLLIAGAEGLGFHVGGALLHGVALAIALTVVTVLHMTLGEQAPKIWALQRSETVSLLVAYPLRIFVAALRPLIWGINLISNAMLRLVGVRGDAAHEAIHDVEELKRVLQASASAGQISARQRLLARNVLGLVDLEVRHVMLPRVDVVFMSLRDTQEQNLAIVRESRHSRIPLCRGGLDTILGIVHARDLLATVLAGGTPDLESMVRDPLVVPDTQPLSQFIVDAQASGDHCGVVVDEHGTTVGLAFLEDALEEIVGPIRDEFDPDAATSVELPGGAFEFPGRTPLPEIADRLGVPFEEDTDTIGGYFAARLGRIPEVGDEIELGPYTGQVLAASRRRVGKVRFEVTTAEEEVES